MRKRFLTLFATGAIVVGACGGAASPSPSAPAASAPASAAASASAGPEIPDLTKTDYAPEAPGKTGGKLITGISGEPVTIWFTYYDTFANDVDAFGPSLWSLWSNTDDFAYYGQLADGVPNVGNGGVVVNSDGTMDVNIKIKSGAQWSDGQPITCDDLAYNVEWVMDKDNTGLASGKVGWEDISSVEGGTTQECIAHFKKVYEQYLLLWSPLLPKHYVSTVPVKDAFKQLYTQADPAKGVYSGPYMPTTWAKGSQIDYVANAKFWETVKKATPNFDEMTLRLFAEPDTEIAAYVNGEIDVGLEFNHTHIDAIKSANVPDGEVSTVDGVTYEQHSWNMARLTDNFGADGAKALIEALHYAVDKDEINTRILNGSATPSCSFTMNLTWFYSDIPCYKYDAAKANELLDAAGFTKGSDGIREKDGKKLNFLGCARADRPYRIDTLRLLSEQLSKIGAKVEVHPTPPEIVFAGWNAQGSDVECNLTHGNYDVAEFAWLATPDPTSISQLYRSDLDPSKGDHSGQNYIRINNPELDTMLNEILTTVDLLKIKEDMAKIQELYVKPENAWPEIALYNWRTVELINPKMKNVVNNSTAATQTWNIEDWWKSE